MVEMRKNKTGKVQVNESCSSERLNEDFDKDFNGINHEMYPQILTYTYTKKQKKQTPSYAPALFVCW